MKDSKKVSNQFSELSYLAEKFNIKPSAVLKAKEDLKTNDREQIERYLEATDTGRVALLGDGMDIKTLGDLKFFLNLLDEKQLSQPAGIIGESKFYPIGGATITTEDYVNPEAGDGSYPVSEYSEEFEGVPLEDPSNTIIPAGHVLIHHDF